MTEPTFEVRAFRALPAAATVAVLVLEGRFTSPAPQSLGRPDLVVEDGASRVDVAPVLGPDAAAGPGGVPWRAAYAIPLATVERASFALAVGRDLLVDLPAPDVGERRDDDPAARLTRLAREANELRHRLDAAADQRRRAEERAAASATALHAVECERDEARAAIADAERRRDEAIAASRRERDEAVAAAERERDEAVAELDLARAELVAAEAAATEQASRASRSVREELERRHEEELAAQRARVQAARRDLQTARAEVEGLRAELEAARAGRHRSAGEGDAEAAQRSEAPTERRDAPAEPPTEERPATEITEPLPPAEEGVRVLSRAPRRRHAPEDETEPVVLSPGATRIGARSITSTRPQRDGPSPVPRIAALIALAIAIAAFVLVVILGVGPG